MPDLTHLGGHVAKAQGSTDAGFGPGHIISGITDPITLGEYPVTFSGMNLQLTNLFRSPLPHVFEHGPNWVISHLSVGAKLVFNGMFRFVSYCTYFVLI